MKTILFTFFLLPLLALSQTATLSGKIVDGAGESLVFSTVVVLNGDIFVAGARVDNNGAYKIENINPGFYRVIVKYAWREKSLGEVVLLGDQTVSLNGAFDYEAQQLIEGTPVELNRGCGKPAMPWSYTVSPSGMKFSADDFRKSAYR